MKTNILNVFDENYITDVRENPMSIDIWKLDQNQNHEFIADEHKILLVISGSLTCSLQRYADEHIVSHQMIFISVGSRCHISTSQGASLICLGPGAALFLYNYPNYTPKQDPHSQKADDRLSVLKFSPLIKAYVVSLKWFLHLGIKDPLHIYIKIRELLLLISISYPLSERMHFFQALLCEERKFSDFIYKNYRGVSSIRELAILSCYSLSGFEKRFRKVFGVPASRWIALRKAAEIYQEISKKQKSTKEISFEYGFSSVSHLHKFCKTNLGLSPGYIRKQVQYKEGYEEMGE